jgi:hypothetical protein
MITRALFVRLEAKTGREEEVEGFLRSALDLVAAEDGTPLWFALRFGPVDVRSSSEESISTVHARRAPIMQASAGLAL